MTLCYFWINSGFQQDIWAKQCHLEKVCLLQLIILVRLLTIDTSNIRHCREHFPEIELYICSYYSYYYSLRLGLRLFFTFPSAFLLFISVSCSSFHIRTISYSPFPDAAVVDIFGIHFLREALRRIRPPHHKALPPSGSTHTHTHTHTKTNVSL
jgi:hypothetical protein